MTKASDTNRSSNRICLLIFLWYILAPILSNLFKCMIKYSPVSSTMVLLKHLPFPKTPQLINKLLFLWFSDFICLFAIKKMKKWWHICITEHKSYFSFGHCHSKSGTSSHASCLKEQIHWEITSCEICLPFQLLLRGWWHPQVYLMLGNCLFQ